MSANTIVVVGIAGVGKTTLVNRLVSRRPELLHVKAGQLLAMAANQASTEVLRLAPSNTIVSNQEILALAFEAFRLEHPSRNVVFDGHVIVDNEVEVVQVPLSIIRRLRPTVIIFVEDTAEAIAARRDCDMERRRPSRAPLELKGHQDLARKLARAYAREIGVRFEQVRAGDLEGLEAKLDGIL